MRGSDLNRKGNQGHTNEYNDAIYSKGEFGNAWSRTRCRATCMACVDRYWGTHTCGADRGRATSARGFEEQREGQMVRVRSTHAGEACRGHHVVAVGRFRAHSTSTPYSSKCAVVSADRRFRLDKNLRFNRMVFLPSVVICIVACEGT
jgi:hypothetical protein